MQGFKRETLRHDVNFGRVIGKRLVWKETRLRKVWSLRILKESFLPLRYGLGKRATTIITGLVFRADISCNPINLLGMPGWISQFVSLLHV